MSLEQDHVFFRNFTVVVALLAAMMVVFFLLALEIGGQVSHIPLSEAAVAERTALIGKVAVAGEDNVGEAHAQDTAPSSAGFGGDAAPDPQPALLVAGDAAAQAEGDAGDAGSHPGESVYNGLCISCHGTGIPGIPQLGDKEAWASRIEKGTEVLYGSVINGFQGSTMMMPPRGGNPGLTDEQIHDSVDYMLEQSR